MEETTNKFKKSCESHADKSNIPVICNSSRQEDGNSKKPHGIHLNPKFFKTINEPPTRHVGPPLRRPPFFNHGPRMQSNDHPPPPHHFPAFSPGYPTPFPHGARFRPNCPPFPGPQHPHPFPPHQFPPPPRFRWQGPPNYSQGHLRPPPLSPYPNNFPPDFNPPVVTNQTFHPPEFQRGYELLHAPPPPPSHVALEPFPGPSYYQVYKDKDAYPNECDSREGYRRNNSRSRSRSPDLRRYRSLSRSSRRSYDSRGSRRSRSLSKQRSSSGSDTLWNSDADAEGNSDYDLSKTLDLLTNKVSDSKSLLKDALRCLGPTKIETMIPEQLRNLDRKKLLRKCVKLLEETDNEELIRVMKGNDIAEAEKGESLTGHSVPKSKSSSSSSSSDSDISIKVRKRHKKKESRKKSKRVKKGRVTQREPESDEESQETSVEEDSSSSEDCTDKLDLIVGGTSSSGPNKSKPGPSAATTQQSLLELIQIEYKTKAINVMLKNLGVATEISSLVSNALHTNGISAIVGNNNDTIYEQVEEKRLEKAESVRGVGTTVGKKHKAPEVITEKPHSSESTFGDDENVPETEFQNNNDYSRNSPAASTFQDSTNVPVIEREIIKEVYDDVLDIDLGANEKLDFLDI